MRSYKDHLRAIGRKPLPRNLRTKKAEGDIELPWDPRQGEYVKHVHEVEQESGNVVPIKGRKRA